MNELDKPLFHLTVGEFMSAIKEANKLAVSEILTKEEPKEELIFGLKALAKFLKCSYSHISKLKQEGVFDGAFKQRGRKIIFEKNKALELFNEFKK